MKPPLPRIFDSARAARVLEALASEGFSPSGEGQALLAAALGNSPFLGRLAIREVAILPQLLTAGYESVLAAARFAALAVQDAAGEALAMAELRRAKRRAALAIALADISGAWDVERVTLELTHFADACVQGALRFLLRQAATDTALSGHDNETLERQTGLTVLAMGKFGAFELNYSSDIDLVVFYDAELFPFARRGEARAGAVEIVRGLVKLLSEITADGYVFRVDLRLRPDAGATQIAISTEAAEAYYESMGQNWERAAMIKARACAGDPRTGTDFLQAIKPFIWRRNLDFAAIEDIHSIKRQIHAHAGHGAVAVAGHNIKLGRGGIREIEFFAQTQQLILGGRNAGLRAPSTIAALEALCAQGAVSRQTAQELEDAYRFLRQLEHRLQMVEDEQTHTLPKTPDGLAHIACFMGFDGAPDFARALTVVLETVQGHYARLFESAPELSDTKGNLVFTGVEDDPETLDTLAAMGFADPPHVAGAIRGWHHGRVRAMRGARTRELLTKLMPALLAALAASADPDAAFVQFDRFLSNLPASVQLFSLLLARPQMLRLLAEIVGSAPRLAAHLARTPETLDALLDPGFLGALPARADLDNAFAAQLAGAPDYESVLDAARRFAREQIFRVGVQIIQGLAPAHEAGPALAAIAECVIAGLLPRVEAELARNTGHVAGASFAVIAMGKLGGREMTAASDLDLVFIYDAPDPDTLSDGARPLAASTYFARLAQRLIAALTMPTAAGGLYDVDMRLRPTGNKGPVAVSLESFMRYHAGQSWTWEHMALTRARVVAGPPTLARRVEAAIRQTLTTQGDAAKIFADARDMRARLAEQFPGDNPWDLKFAPGGLVDIEFIAQALQLRHGARGDMLDTNTIAALEKLSRAGLLPGADTLIAAASLEQALTQVLRIAIDGPLEEEVATAGLKSLLARSGGARDFAALKAGLAQAQNQAHAMFTALLGE